MPLMWLCSGRRVDVKSELKTSDVYSRTRHYFTIICQEGHKTIDIIYNKRKSMPRWKDAFTWPMWSYPVKNTTWWPNFECAAILYTKIDNRQFNTLSVIGGHLDLGIHKKLISSSTLRSDLPVWFLDKIL